MRRTFILDTNVLLFDAESFLNFAEHRVIIPITVIEELDNFKKDQGEIGRNARRFTRLVDELRMLGSLTEGVPLNGIGGTLQVVLYTDEVGKSLPCLDMGKADNRILAVAAHLRDRSSIVALITKDVNLRVKADAYGISAADYETDKIEIETLYGGYREVIVDGATIDGFYAHSGISVNALSDLAVVKSTNGPLMPNEFVLLRDQFNDSHTGLGRYKEGTGHVYPLKKSVNVWGLSPRNLEQQVALNLLLDDNIKLVTLAGKAGTGKTLLAIAAGLAKVTDENVYRKLIVSRPVFPMGKDLGFLPGDLDEKLAPWMQPIKDNLEFLMQEYNPTPAKPERARGGKKGGKPSRAADFDDKESGRYGSGYKELQMLGLLEVEPLVYIRGRSIPNQYMIVDEAQNLTPHEVKTIITRAGEGTKIILTGDPYQIDNPYVDASSNGLSYAVEKFKEHAIAGHITLTKGERSALAELASNIL